MADWLYFRIKKNENNSEDCEIDENIIQYALENLYHHESFDCTIEDITDSMKSVIDSISDLMDDEDEEDSNKNVNRTIYTIIAKPDNYYILNIDEKDDINVGDVLYYFEYDKDPVTYKGTFLGYLENVYGNLTVVDFGENHKCICKSSKHELAKYKEPAVGMYAKMLYKEE